MAASRYHFQAALAVGGHACLEEEAPVLAAARPTPRPIVGGWMLLIVICCVIISGIAVFFSFWFDEGTVESVTATPLIEQRPALQHTPRWAWHEPRVDRSPVRADAANLATPTPTPAPSGIRPAVHTEAVPASTPPVIDQPTFDSTPLGPSAHAKMQVDPSRVTIEQADQAYFTGDYERAVTMYEVLLASDEQGNPRLHQDLAWCYQHLGNSQQAMAHLRSALDGYQAQLRENPHNTAAEQGKQTCIAALDALMASRAESPADPHP